MTDDLDGCAASETVTFTLDGVTFEIDLTAEHAAELRSAFAPYVAAGRRVAGSSLRARVSAGKVATSYSVPAVRAWAASNHIDIPARGRIPSAVIARYRAAGF